MICRRFLRARSFQPEAALKQFQSAAAWRQKHDVENLYKSGFTVEEFEDAKRFYPRWTGRRDKVTHFVRLSFRTISVNGMISLWLPLDRKVSLYTSTGYLPWNRSRKNWTRFQQRGGTSECMCLSQLAPPCRRA